MRGRLVVGTVVAGLVLAVTPGAATGTPGDDGTASPGAPVAPAGSYQVTLLTGDVLRVEVAPGGGTEVAVQQRGGPSGALRIYEIDGHTHVVPLGAQPYLDSGLLDRRLFDVTLLVEQGYHDAAAPRLPLIVEYAPAARAAAAVPDGATAGAPLPSVDARAVAADKAGVRDFWADLVGGGGPVTRATSLAHGIERVWLDGRVEALLDRSVPHVGAPAAWAAGYDGSGVTIAVLDTGVDADHPDLAGRVSGAESFTPDGTTDDRHGHGTHVASIAAGAAPGVAPGADLLVGKVLTDTGFGQESWAIAGMEWAAAAGADVVNLSLGSFPTDGSDPMSQAVDELSETTGTLFVTAAGNSGPASRSVSTPAAADAALAVGNAQLDGTIFPSSSRGPRVLDGAVKPEISAPGTGIVAARAGGGRQAMTGTSMAAPHVAGAAAILAQRHPEWSGEQLKAALVGSSTPMAGATVWEQGAGLLAVDRAVAQTVQVSDGTVHLGYLEPDADLIVTRTVGYRNDGAAPVTLDLAAAVSGEDGVAAPAGAVTVDPERLSLPPGGSALLTVRLDATGLPAGEYAGRLVATGGPSPVITALGFYLQGELVDVSISLTDRDGEPAGGYVTLLNYDLGVFEPGGFIEGSVGAGQTRVFRIPRATYSITAMISSYDESGRFLSELSMVADPQRPLPRNSSLHFDARDARPVEVDTPRGAAAEVLVLGWARGPEPEQGNQFVDSLLVLPAAGEVERVSVAPTPAVTDGEFDVYATWHLAEPWLTVRLRDVELRPTYLVGSPRYEGDLHETVVDVGTSPAGQDLRGRVALIREDPARPPAEQVREAAAAGAVLALVAPAEPGILRGNGFGLPIPGGTLSYEEGERLRERLPGRARAHGVVDSPYTYDLIFHEPDRVPDSMAYQVELAELATIDARYHGDGTGRTALLNRQPTAPCRCSLTPVMEVHTLPYQRTEYVSTGDAVWTARVTSGLVNNLRATELRYQAGARYTETWGAAPLAPTAASAVVTDVSVRDGDTLRLRVPPIGDAAGHTGNSAGPSTGVLSRDGEVLAELFGGFGDVPVPAGEAEYRLAVSTSNGAPDSTRLSTATETAWTFRTGHVDGTATLPLLSPIYRLPLSRENALDPRHPVRLVLAAAYPDHSAAALASAGVWVSYDDGARWRPASVRMLPDGTVQATLPPAVAPPEYAALRVLLTDEAGNTVEQTVHRAYRAG